MDHLKKENVMNHKKSEKGQALIIIVVAIIGLLAITGLTVDGGRLYADRANAQGSADSAALGAALAKAKNQSISSTDLTNAARNSLNYSGYGDGVHSTLKVENAVACGCQIHSCNGQLIPTEYLYNDEYIYVQIKTNVDTTFARLVGVGQMHNCVEALSRAKPLEIVPLFDGNAVVGLSPNTGNCAFDTGNSNSKTWNLTGGGIFSNGCMVHDKGTLNIPNNKCLTAVGSIDDSGGGNHACVKPSQAANSYAYPEDIAAIMPPNPCTGAISGGRYAGGGKIPTSGQTTFNNDIFCINDFTTLDAHIVLNNSTLYVTDTDFDVKFNGGGSPGFSGTATTTAGSPYQGYYMIIALLSKAEADACHQNIEYRGNGGGTLVGTILAPSACFDLRGNSAADNTNGQMIFYRFTSNGTADLKINYDQNKTGKRIIRAWVELIK
jgi:hypothetical protein